MHAAQSVVLLVVRHRIPGEQGDAARWQVLAEDAQILDVLDAKNQDGCVARYGCQAAQVVRRKRHEPRQAHREPGIQRLKN